jgi:hypothetical protein
MPISLSKAIFDEGWSGDRRADRNITNDGLPDVDALLRRQVHLVTQLHVECLVPGVDVSNDAVDPIFGWAVLVRQQLRSKRAFALLRLPAVAIGNEEALVAGETVDNRRLTMLGDIFAIGRVGDFETTEIAEVLASVSCPLMYAGDRLIAVVLCNELVGMRRVELGGGG